MVSDGTVWHAFDVINGVHLHNDKVVVIVIEGIYVVYEILMVGNVMVIGVDLSILLVVIIILVDEVSTVKMELKTSYVITKTSKV